MKSRHDDRCDVVGIGFGPANLALAVAMEESVAARRLRTVFLEQKPGFAWHPHMLLEDTVMQISFLKDLVTQRNPESRFTFINYLKSHGRLNDFINLKSFYPTRTEFNRYMAWVAARLSADVRYGSPVVAVRPSEEAPGQWVEVLYRDGPSGAQRRLLTRNLVVAIGGQPNMPVPAERQGEGGRVWHSSQYLANIARLGTPEDGHRFVVVGRGQSAAEIAHDLHGRFPTATVTCLFRGYGLKPSDSSEFVNGIFDAEFVDQISAAVPALRQRLLDEHRDTNYAVVDAPLISRLYQIQYRERVSGEVRLHFRNLTRALRVVETRQSVQVVGEDARSGGEEVLEADTVIMATGYTYPNPPPVLAGIGGDLERDPQRGRVRVNRHYRAAVREGVHYGVYLQGCNEATHGLSDTLLSNLSIRAGEILGDLLATTAETPPQPQPQRQVDLTVVS